MISARSIIFSSTVCSVTNLYTYTCFFCPIRCALSWACMIVTSTAGWTGLLGNHPRHIHSHDNPASPANHDNRIYLSSNQERDQLMKVFNAPDSEKFIFLLSTRAGGLGNSNNPNSPDNPDRPNNHYNSSLALTFGSVISLYLCYRYYVLQDIYSYDDNPDNPVITL